MALIRRRLMLPVLALGALTALPAWADADENAVARNLEAFRTAQMAHDAAALTALSAPELSYSHSSGRVEDRATFVANATSGKSTFVSLAYRDPTIRVVGSTAIVRFNWAGEQQAAADGARTATNLHILMVWQKQGNDWKLLARSATKL
jgi:ketosteroid isomerase-like protein